MDPKRPVSNGSERTEQDTRACYLPAMPPEALVVSTVAVEGDDAVDER